MPMSAYPLNFTIEGDDHVVRSRDLPQLLTAGSTHAEALELAEDALAVVLLTYMEKGIAIPQPSAVEPGDELVSPPAPVAAKLAVWRAFIEAKISKSELARRMNVAEGEVRRVLDPNYGSKLDKLDQAARALGRRIQVELAPA